MKPLIVFVDDEPLNQVAFESLLPEDWTLVFISNSLEAINEISKIDPWIVVCDQRMPGISGNEILETVKTIKPFAIRIITTGFSSERLVIDSVRQAEVHDYLIKPWADDFEARIKRWASLFAAQRDKRQLQADLLMQEKELSDRNIELSNALTELKEAAREKQRVLQELECWVHPFILNAMNDGSTFPLQRNLSLLVMDIIDSSNIHGVMAEGLSVRERILQMFWEIVVKHGGEIESQEGDKAYANFGLSGSRYNQTKAAFAAGVEFIAALQSLNFHYDIITACGLGLHVANGCNVFLRQTVAHTAKGIVTRKKFDTCSPDVDLVHRIESVTHSLPGSNMLITDLARQQLGLPDHSLIDAGEQIFKGQKSRTKVWLFPSSQTTPELIATFKMKLDASSKLLDEKSTVSKAA